MTKMNGTHDLEFPAIKHRYPQVRALALALHGRAFIAGGAARAMAHDIPYTDIDVFCLTDDAEESIAHDLLAIGYVEIVLPQKSPCRVFSPPALPNLAKILGSYVDVQLIRPIFGRFGTPMEVMQQFGFFCEQFAYDSRHLMSSFEADRDVSAKELHINANTNPLALTWRINKYGLKGFTISRQEVCQIFEKWEQIGYDARRACYHDAQAYSVDNSGQTL